MLDPYRDWDWPKLNLNGAKYRLKYISLAIETFLAVNYNYFYGNDLITMDIKQGKR